jgi:hypothetical protein
MEDVDVWNVRSTTRRVGGTTQQTNHDYIHTVTVMPLSRAVQLLQLHQQLPPPPKPETSDGYCTIDLAATTAQRCQCRPRRCLDQHDTDRVRPPALIAAPGRMSLIGTASRCRCTSAAVSDEVDGCRISTGPGVPNPDSWRAELTTDCCVSSLRRTWQPGELIAPPCGLFRSTYRRQLGWSPAFGSIRSPSLNDWIPVDFLCNLLPVWGCITLLLETSSHHLALEFCGFSKWDTRFQGVFSELTPHAVKSTCFEFIPV